MHRRWLGLALLLVVAYAVVAQLAFASALDEVDLDGRVVAEFADHDGEERQAASNVVSIVRSIRSLRVEPAVLPTVDVRAGEAVEVPLTFIATGTEQGRYRVDLQASEDLTSRILHDGACSGSSLEGMAPLDAFSAGPAESVCSVLEVAVAAEASTTPLVVNLEVIELSAAGADLGPALQLQLAFRVWDRDPVSDAVLSAQSLTNPVRFGGVLVIEVEVANPSSERLEGFLDFLQPPSTRTFAAEALAEPDAAGLAAASTVLRPALSSSATGVATPQGWRVPLSIAGEGVARFHFFSRVLLGATSPLNAGLILTSTREQGALAAVSISVSVEVEIEDEAFDRSRSLLLGRVAFADDGAAAGVVGVRLILPDGRQTLSDANGMFHFPELARGWWRVQIDPGSLPVGYAVVSDGPAPFSEWIYVDGLTRLDVMVASRSVAAAAPEAATAAAEAGVERPTGLAWLHAEPELTLRGAGVDLAFQAPLGAEVALRLNGDLLGPEVRGVVHLDLARAEQRVELANLPWVVGINTLELSANGERQTLQVRVPGEPSSIEVELIQGVADGVQPIVVRVSARDRFGTLSGDGPLRVESELPLDAASDARPETPGVAAELRAGEALLRFAPRVGGGSFPVHLAFGAVRASHELSLQSPGRTLATGQATVGVQLGAAPRLWGDARAYLELAGDLGSLHLVVDGAVAIDADGARLNPGLEALPEPSYRVTGVAGEVTRPLASDDGVAFRYQQGSWTLAYERASMGFEGISASAFGSALRGVWSDGEAHRIIASLGRVASQRVVLDLEPDGTRRYPLPYTPVDGSEAVVLLILDGERVLERVVLRAGVDYTMQSRPATLVLMEPLWPTDELGRTQRLELRFLAPDAPRDTWIGGVGWTFTSAPLRAYASLARLPVDNEAVLSAAAGVHYRVEGLHLSASVEQRGTEELRVRLAGDARWRDPASGFELRATAAWRGADDLQARVSLEIPIAGATGAELALERDQRGLHAAAALTTRWVGWDAGAALSTTLGDGSWEARLSSSGRLGALRVALAHVHPWGSDRSARSTLRLETPITDRLSARLSVRHSWSAETLVEASLLQRWGVSEWEVGWVNGTERPASAQLAFRAPLRLSDALRLDLAAGAALQSGALPRLSWSSQLLYRDRNLEARLALDASYHAGWEKRLVQASLSGAIGEGQSLRADLSAELEPVERLRFSVGYALHREGFSLLAQQSLQRSGGGGEVEGRADAHWRLAPALSVRPRVAYRMDTADSESLIVQTGLGVSYHVTPRWGATGVAYLGWQPVVGATGFAAGVELFAALTEGLVLVVGYTWGDGPALLLGAGQGLHVRFEVHGGTP